MTHEDDEKEGHIENEQGCERKGHEELLRWKRKENNQAAADRHASFTPFIVSVDGFLAKEAELTLKRFADKVGQVIC